MHITMPAELVSGSGRNQALRCALEDKRLPNHLAIPTSASARAWREGRRISYAYSRGQLTEATLRLAIEAVLADRPWKHLQQS
jgi:hypothetical protein